MKTYKLVWEHNFNINIRMFMHLVRYAYYIQYYCFKDFRNKCLMAK